MSFQLPADLQATPGIRALYQEIGPSYRWLVVITTMLGSFATLLTSTIVNVAIPDIMGALGITLDQAQWLATAFLASGTITMLLTAWSMRAFGVRATANVAMLFFLFGSVLGGVAPNAETLFFARVVQGAASGLITPISMVMISQVFPLSHRGRAMGLMSVGTVLAPALGPTLGGYLVDNLSWRWVFLMAIPFAAITIPLAQICLPQREERGARPTFDWWGVILCTLWLMAMLLGLARGQREGFEDDLSAMLLVLAVGSFVAWVWWEFHAKVPMLELRLFLVPKFAAAALITLVVGVGLYSSTYLLPLFLQTVMHLKATDSGLLLAPPGLVMAVMFPIAGWLSDISSARRMILIGLVIFAISSYPMIFVDANMPVLQIMFWYVVGRVGLACVFPSLNAATLNPLPVVLIAQAAGATNFLRQLGGAIGINFCSLVLQERVSFYTSNFFSDLHWGNVHGFEMVRLMQEEFFRLGVPGYQAFEAAYGFTLGAVAQEAMMMGYRDGFLFVFVIFVVVLFPAWFLDSSKRRTYAPTTNVTPARS